MQTSDTSAAPGTSAVIVIDLQTGMFDGKLFEPIHQAGPLQDKVRAVIAWARDNKHPLCFIRHDAEAGDPLAPDAPGWPVWPALGQRPDEPTFSKNVGDAFSQPALLEWLEAHGARKVILLGAQTDFCVAATTDGALALGLDVSIIADAHSTWASDGQTADEIIAKHNARFAAAGARVQTSEQLMGA
ncbi:isochorismatase family protein [Undibacterium terreum]|uniref:Isochorismatase n=1 Tax=Undibacterium terreum TaxID=1224302 RepID=A0A916XE81_9BURK|nr:isochorismatase family protein [Undibacterium terreum]GGC64021.1 isochorismatase [Undibacterium terreum]